MRLTMRNNLTCGFLILAFGMMLSDCYHLLRTHPETSWSATQSAQPMPKF